MNEPARRRQCAVIALALVVGLGLSACTVASTASNTASPRAASQASRSTSLSPTVQTPTVSTVTPPPTHPSQSAAPSTKARQSPSSTVATTAKRSVQAPTAVTTTPTKRPSTTTPAAKYTGVGGDATADLPWLLTSTTFGPFKLGISHEATAAIEPDLRFTHSTTECTSAQSPTTQLIFDRHGHLMSIGQDMTSGWITDRGLTSAASTVGQFRRVYGANYASDDSVTYFAVGPHDENFIVIKSYMVGTAPEVPLGRVPGTADAQVSELSQAVNDCFNPIKPGP